MRSKKTEYKEYDAHVRRSPEMRGPSGNIYSAGENETAATA